MWGAVLTLTLAGTTGFTPIPVGQAEAEIAAAVELAGREPSMTVTERDDVVQWSAAGGSLTRSLGQVTKAFSDGSIYAAIPKSARADVRAYLDSPTLAWMLMPQRVDWPTEDPLPSMFSVEGLSPKSAALRTEPARSLRVRIAGRARLVLTLDTSGRPASMTTWMRAKDGWKRIGRITADYTPVTISKPSGDEALPFAEVRPAVDARTIPDRVRYVVRFVLKGKETSVAGLRQSARSNVRHYNRGYAVPARLHSHRIPHGVRIWGHNEFTGVTVERRIVRRAGKWVVIRRAVQGQ